MLKWQQKQRQRVHDYKVQNAKSDLKRYSKSRQKGVNVSRTRPPLSSQYQNKDKLPINKILQLFELQQYTHLINMYKFTQSLVKMDGDSDKMADMLEHVKQKDKQRFSSLLHTLVIMSKSLNSTKKIQQTSKPSMCYPSQHSVSNSNKTPLSVPKSNNSQSKFRIKTKNLITRTPQLEKQSKAYFGYSEQRNLQKQKTADKRKRKRSFASRQTRRRAKDDLTLVHSFEINEGQKKGPGKLKQIQENSHIIRRLVEKLGKLKKAQSKESVDQIQLDMREVEQMYLSFDSATLSSNIKNIDLQQINHCLALQILNLVSQNQIQTVVTANKDKINSLLRESFIIVQQQQSRQSKTQLDSMHECKQSQIQQNLESDETLNESQQSSLLESPGNSQNPENVNIRLKCSEGMESSIWGNNFIASVIQDFSCFDGDNEVSGRVCVEDIKNFVDLIMMAGKMEKQIPILAFIYLKRLLYIAKNARITQKNWRNLTIVTLIEASKIWDDRSLQNHSFAKVIKPYTTFELNRLEKYLLFYIDYKLNINKKQFSQSYFNLKKHSGQCSHTASLVRLDLKTIKKLQQTENVDEKDKIDKKQFIKKCMNKSF